MGALLERERTGRTITKIEHQYVVASVDIVADHPKYINLAQMLRDEVRF